MRKLRSFEEFWSHYLHEHRDPRTRTMHFIGTTIAGLMIFAWMATGHESYLVLALVGSYGLAWFSHLVAGYSRSATFWHPLWSLRADLLMYAKWLNRTLGDDLSSGLTSMGETELASLSLATRIRREKWARLETPP